MHRASVNLEQLARWASVIYGGMNNYISIIDDILSNMVQWLQGTFEINRNFRNKYDELLNTKTFIFGLVHCDPG